MNDKDNTVEVILKNDGYVSRVSCGSTVLDETYRCETVEDAMNCARNQGDCGGVKIELFDGWFITSDGVFCKPCYGEFWSCTRETWEVWSPYGYHDIVRGNFFKCVEVLEMAYAEHQKAYKDMLLHLLGTSKDV